MPRAMVVSAWERKQHEDNLLSGLFQQFSSSSSIIQQSQSRVKSHMNPQSNEPNLGVINVPQQPHKNVIKLTDLQARLGNVVEVRNSPSQTYHKLLIGPLKVFGVDPFKGDLSTLLNIERRPKVCKFHASQYYVAVMSSYNYNVLATLREGALQ